ncbi:hypothetical protein ACQKQA_07015 [Pseudomonas sp. NPDC089530]|uniref:hypothetical protein n=1 Tax=Pseudomonas sp. NPDC089530 TaxID=3390651 RepID=UPI003D02AA81
MSIHTQRKLMQKHVADLQAQLLGIELMRVAGEAALTAGDELGVAVFDEYSTCGGHDISFLSDAVEIARTWARAHTSEDFLSWSNHAHFSTDLGGCAAACIVAHWGDVYPKFGPFKEPEMVFPEDEVETPSDAEFEAD